MLMRLAAGGWRWWLLAGCCWGILISDLWLAGCWLNLSQIRQKTLRAEFSCTTREFSSRPISQ
jgi:hypothetical protein